MTQDCISTDLERDIPDRRVRLTATRTFVRASKGTVLSEPRQSNRLQQPVSSDPNMHRAPKPAQIECEWKHGEQVVFPNQTRNTNLGSMAKKSKLSRDGPLESAVNWRAQEITFSVDRGRPSHGSPRRFEELPKSADFRDASYLTRKVTRPMSWSSPVRRSTR